MNQSLNPTSRGSLPPGSLRDAGEFSLDETDSGVFQLSDSAVLLVTHAGQELGRTLEREGFAVIVANAAAGLDELAFIPRFAIIEMSVPGACDLLGRIGLQDRSMHVIAVLAPGDNEAAALAAGATLTLRAPLDERSVFLCLRRFRAQEEVVRQSRRAFDKERGSMPAPVLESVLSTIGKEIGNPLAAAVASIECLRDSDSPNGLDAEARIGAVEDTALALRRIQDVMSAVTSLVRGTAPSLERISLWDAAESAVDAMRSRDVRLELAGDRNVRGWACAPLLEQVLINLVQNALDATHEEDNPQVLVRVYRAGLEARISVRDNGPGIPSALRGRIFEPFFSTKGQRGTGLGLVLVHHAVARMGGIVSLGSGGHGAVFRVRLRGT